MGTLKKAVALLSAIGLLCVTSLFAATGWTRVDYTSSTTFVGFILVSDNYVPTAVTGDSIGAFVGTECRMKAELFTSPNSDTLWVSSILHGGDINPRVATAETVTFKIWHKANNTVADLDGSTVTAPEGNIFKFPLGKPVISTDAKLESLTISGVSVSPAFNPQTENYSVELASGTALPTQNAYTVKTANAKAKTEIVYATDFAANNKTTITVTAEDASTVKVYTITFTQGNCTVTAPTAVPTVVICPNTLTDVTATSSLVNPTFEWKNASGNVVGSTAKLATGVAGEYFVTQTVGCTGPAAKVTVSVTPLDAITITANNALSNPICESASVDLAGIATPAGGVYSGAGVTANTLAATGLVGAGKTIIYTITKDNCTAEKAITFDVVAKPAVSLTGLPADVCKNATAFALTGGAPANGVYSINGNTVTSFDPALYSGDVTVNYDYSAAPGCANTANDLIKVTETPAVTAADQVVVLPATATAFNITAANGATVTWYDANKTVIPSVTATFTPTETAVGVYKYYVSQKVGACESELTLVSLTITDCAAVKPEVSGDQTVCAGTVATFTATPGANSEIIWKNEQGTVITSVGNELKPATDTKGTYLFFASQKSTAANSCESPQTKVSLVVNEVPVVSITIPSESLTTASAPIEIQVSDAQATLTGTGVTTGTKTFTPATAGAGTHTLTATLTVLGCTGTDSKDITVSPAGGENAALLAAITEAEAFNAVSGYAKGQYIDGADSYNSSIAAAIIEAKSKSTSTDSTVLADALSTLTTTVNYVKSKANPADYTALKVALDAADAKVAVIGTNVGSSVGQYKTAEVNTLKAAIAAGKTLYGTTIQATVGANVDSIIKATDISPIKDIAVDYSLLDSTINSAKDHLVGAVEGPGVGQYLSGSKDALQLQIDIAELFTTSKDQTKVDAATARLLAAIDVFKKSINYAVNTETLIIAIGKAKTIGESAKEGPKIGEYKDLASAIAPLNAAIAIGEAKLEVFKTEGTAEQVAAATKAVNDAKLAFAMAANQSELPDFTALNKAITAAEAKLERIKDSIGSGIGQYKSAEVDTLKKYLETAKGLINSNDVNAINAAIGALTVQTGILANQADYTALDSTITAAQAKYDAAKVGPGAGQYTQAIKDAFGVSIATAKEGLKSTDATVIAKAASDLAAATTKFAADAIIIVPLDYSKLDASITKAESDLFNLTRPTNVWIELNTAKGTAATARDNAKTQEEVNAAKVKLDAAITKYIITGVEENTAGINVYPTLVKESVTIDGLTGTTTITISAQSGIIVSTLTTNNAAIVIPVSELSSGKNVITTISTDGTASSTKVIVE